MFVSASVFELVKCMCVATGRYEELVREGKGKKKKSDKS